MPVTAEYIESLSGYHGADACPDDFDEFWAERMAEADACELSFEIVEADIPSGATCSYYDLWFRGFDGARLHAKYILPRTNEPVPVVMQFHGYPGSSRSWFESSSFTGMGMAIVAFDCPGQGGPSEDAGGYAGPTVDGHIIAGLEGPARDLYYVRLHQSIRILMRIVCDLPEIDRGRVYVNGASQGGGLGLACAALNADVVSKAAILYPFLSDFRMVWELEADEIAYEGLRYYTHWFDADGTRVDEMFSKLAYFDTKNFAHLVTCDVLFGTGLSDGVCPPITQCAVYNELSCPKRRELFEGFAHEEIQAFDDMIIGFFCNEGE